MDYDPRMEERVARLEVAMESVQSDIKEIKDDLRSLRKESKEDLQALRKELDEKLSIQRKESENNFRILFSGLITVALGLGGMVAKGFGWL